MEFAWYDIIGSVGVLLVLCTGALLISWMYLPSPTVFGQSCVALLMVTLSLYMPVEQFQQIGKGFLAFSILIAIGCMIFLPTRISFWLTPRLGNQQRLKKFIFYVIWIGLILQILIGG